MNGYDLDGLGLGHESFGLKHAILPFFMWKY
jgi:hypothetical protein